MRRPLIVGVSAAIVLGGVVAAVIVRTHRGDSSRKAAVARLVALPAIYKSGGYFTEQKRKPAAGRLTGTTPLLESSADGPIEIARAAYALRAFPAKRVTLADALTARRGFAKLSLRLRASLARGRRSATWQPLGAARFRALPMPYLSRAARPYLTSGRVTALAVGPRCVAGDCRLWVGTAGGGVFRTDDALAARPGWTSASTGLTSAAIGSLTVDPHDAAGNTLYAGTGEESAYGDSEAGTGVFRSTDGGRNWTILPGSVPIARDRAVPSMAIDPADPKTIYVATAISVHGSTFASGGASEPPGAAPLGLYRSTDGGQTFALVFTRAVPFGFGTVAASINQVALDPNDAGTVYVAATAAGLFRQSQQIDGDDAFHEVFRASNNDPYRTHPVRFALADLGSATRIYVGDSASGIGGPVSELFRVDDASVPAATLAGTGGDNAGWTKLSSRDPSAVGFDSYDYCGDQCDYDNVVATPPGQPDTVLLGGFFDYAEAQIGASNGRATLRSTDAGVHFTDLSADARKRPMVMHPDEHAIAFAPGNPEIAFIGSDGGLVRTSGKYANASRVCVHSAGVDLARCRRLLSAVPTRITSLNDGLQSLQLYSISVGPKDGTILAGSQDNGTWEASPRGGWRQTAGGDGGQSGFAPRSPQVRFHTYYQKSIEVNFHGFNPNGWDFTLIPLEASREKVSFYAPLVVDPLVDGRVFTGLEHVWRTKDFGGRRSVLDAQCNRQKLVRAGARSIPFVCGDWKPLGANLTGSTFGDDRHGNFVVQVAVAPSDKQTLWAATLPGRVFVSRNANVAARRVRFARVDLHDRGSQNDTPGRLVSAIVVDRKKPNHAWISFSGYDAHTPADMPGHVFDVRFHPGTRTATWTNISYGLPDMPITALVRDQRSGDLYASTDFGVLRLRKGAHSWTDAAPGLPVVAVYGLTISGDGRTLYAATHGRGAWTLSLAA